MAAKRATTKPLRLAALEFGALLEDLRSQQLMVEALDSRGKRLTRTKDGRFSRVEARIEQRSKLVLLEERVANLEKRRAA
jgi:hypothetical protein